MNVVTHENIQAHEEILLQFSANRDDYIPTGSIIANKGAEYKQFISQIFGDTPKRHLNLNLGNVEVMSLDKENFDPKHSAGFGSVAKVVSLVEI